MKKLMYCVILLVLPCLIVGTAYGRKIKVPKHYPTIQAAIDAASEGDIVLVADGTYTGPDNKNLDFGGKDITVRSQNGPTNTIIDCEDDGRGFWIHSGETEKALIQGFTITNGYMLDGCGILVESSSLTIADCVITNSYTGEYNGGGIYSVDSDLTINNSTISGNWSFTMGGGMYIIGGSATIADSTFEDNFGWAGGGGISASDSALTITNSTFSENVSDGDYGGGGGIDAGGSTLTITDSTFSENIGALGGGIAVGGGSFFSITNSTFTSNHANISGGGIYNFGSSGIITNSIFQGNMADYDLGGAIGQQGESSLTITNCTFVGNVGNYEENSAILNWPSSSANITNSIFWGDDSLFGQEQIVNYGSSSSTVSYCNIDQDGYADTNGNIREDPLFVDSGYWDGDTWVEGDYHLTADSPCIDAGTKEAPELPKFDFEGDRRKGPFPDIGADEYKKQKHTH